MYKNHKSPKLYIKQEEKLKKQIESIHPWYIKKEIEQRLIELEAIKAKITQSLTENENKCFGKSLRVVNNHNSYAYYVRRTGKDSKGLYLSKENQDLAQNLALQEYNRKLLVEVDAEIEILKNIKENWQDDGIQEIYKKLPKGKQILCTPVILPDENYISIWKNKTYTGKQFSSEKEDFITAKGERVRSKSEVILADTLTRFRIPYRYEFPLSVYLKNGEKIEIYPDFCCLNVRTRQEFFWEHLGMVDNPEYAETAVNKILTYRNNGFFEGENILYSYETSKTPISSKSIEVLIKKYLI